jgi:hypothetical protein
VRAVYVPAHVVPAGAARLEATAPAAVRGGTLILYPADRRVPRRTPLTPEQLRGLLRQWVRGGRGRAGCGSATENLCIKP